VNPVVPEQFYYVSPSPLHNTFRQCVRVCTELYFQFLKGERLLNAGSENIISLHQIKETKTTIHAHSLL
jgi:hypothetical protein